MGPTRPVPWRLTSGPAVGVNLTLYELWYSYWTTDPLSLSLGSTAHPLVTECLVFVVHFSGHKASEYALSTLISIRTQRFFVLIWSKWLVWKRMGGGVNRLLFLKFIGLKSIRLSSSDMSEVWLATRYVFISPIRFLTKSVRKKHIAKRRCVLRLRSNPETKSISWCACWDVCIRMFLLSWMVWYTGLGTKEREH